MENKRSRLNTGLATEEPTDTLLKVEDVANILGVKRDTVTRWLRAGAVAAIKLSNSGGWRVKRSELEAWLERSTQELGAEHGKGGS
jgi:excisionase family DNA binding protein